MASIRIIFFASLLSLSPTAMAESRHDQQFPKLDFRTLLELVVAFEKKPVIVSDSAVFQIETSLMLPKATSSETRKVLHAILLLNGYELVEKAGELHLTKVLTKKQCTAMMNALGADGEFPKESERPLPRVRVAKGAELPANRVIVREKKPAAR
ncbi:MAG: hypothetical protein AAGI48_06980 [Verrucomicrobiota bacterium]